MAFSDKIRSSDLSNDLQDKTNQKEGENGWKSKSTSVSMPEVNASIAVDSSANFWRKLFAFSGPGFLVAVGYMDPGNWATDLAGGAQFGYIFLSVIMISNSDGHSSAASFIKTWYCFWS